MTDNVDYEIRVLGLVPKNKVAEEKAQRICNVNNCGYVEQLVVFHKLSSGQNVYKQTQQGENNAEEKGDFSRMAELKKQIGKSKLEIKIEISRNKISDNVNGIKRTGKSVQACCGLDVCFMALYDFFGCKVFFHNIYPSNR